MKTITVSWTYRDIIEVPDDATPDDIEDILDNMDMPVTWNDREWDWAIGENW